MKSRLIMSKRWWIKIVIALIFLGVILIFVRWHGFIFSNLSEKTEIVKYWVQKLGVWAPLVYCLGFILRPIVFFPATPYAILGGILFGSIWGTLYVVIGAMCSGICEFLFVRYFADERVKTFLENKTKKVSGTISKHGFITVFLVRIIPNVAFDLQNCGLALAPIKFSHYALGTLLGCLPACIFYASFGNLALNWFVPWQVGFVVSFGICLFLLRFFLFKANKYRDNNGMGAE